jgi:hypothetical protein
MLVTMPSGRSRLVEHGALFDVHLDEAEVA